jgi:acyl carrier protein
MTNLEKYNKAFFDVLSVKAEQLEGLEYSKTLGWDSVAHMRLTAALEEAFDIMFETEDMVAFSSYKKGKEILKKYDVDIG